MTKWCRAKTTPFFRGDTIPRPRPQNPSLSGTPRKRIPSRYASLSVQYSEKRPLWQTALRAISAWMSKVFMPGTCVAECQYTSVGESAKRSPEQAASETATLRKRNFAYLFRKTTTTMERRHDGDDTTVGHDNSSPPPGAILHFPPNRVATPFRSMILNRHVSYAPTTKRNSRLRPLIPHALWRAGGTTMYDCSA